MEGGGDAQPLARLPQGVVVVEGVVAEAVDPPPRGALGARKRSGDRAGEHHRSQPELPHRVLELLDRLVGREARDAGDRGHPFAVVSVDLGQVAVERPGHDPPQLVSGQGRHREPGRRVEHGEVDAELVEARLEQPREHGRGPVERVARR